MSCTKPLLRNRCSSLRPCPLPLSIRFPSLLACLRKSLWHFFSFPLSYSTDFCPSARPFLIAYILKKKTQKTDLTPQTPSVSALFLCSYLQQKLFKKTYLHSLSPVFLFSFSLIHIPTRYLSPPVH